MVRFCQTAEQGQNSLAGLHVFQLPENARWNADRDAVEFGVGIGEYQGMVRVARQVFRRFLDGAATPERCLETYHLQRARFERIAELKLRHRELTDDDNVEVTGRDPGDSAG